MLSSPSAQIVNAIAESNFVSGPHGKRVEAYGPTMGIATAIIALGIAFTASVGPEKRGSRFENAVIGQSSATEMVDAKVSDIETGSMDKTAAIAERVEIVAKH